MRNSVNQNIFRAKESYFKDTLLANKNNPKKRGALLTNSYLITRKAHSLTKLSLMAI